MDDDRFKVLMALRGVVDPEVGLDIVTMGLVYGLSITPEEIELTFTLTTEGCPMGEVISRMTRAALERAAGGRRVRLVLAWDPPWDPRMITEEARRALRTGGAA